ncbi:Phosphatidylinositol N-acetyglucosaminlytransferase subunit P-related [Zea mays]|uniref:Phosphatidylinositol N-acetyglucosaminlytransferase subunit P-related n=1 Tax=Zea mays TaxID=4577 RepID=A0A1D6PDC6_MAIZE|nr:Phosphatidylinositol N-acetyglucosaminlytransferase subunit P-related [Zea mays]
MSMAGIARGRSRWRQGDGSSNRNAAHSTVPNPDHQEIPCDERLCSYVVLAAGVVSSRKQATYPGMLSDSVFATVDRQSKTRKAIAVPMKILIEEEFSNDVNSRHISPGAVGRLMGLDSLPSSGIHNKHRHTKSHAPKTSPSSFHGRTGLHDIPHRRSVDTINVFEGMEATKTNMHRSPRSKIGSTTSRSDKVVSADIDFIRQKFMDAKRLSIDESLHISEEFNETLDALVSNSDLLLDFLQNFDPAVIRDLHNHGSPSSTANCITILKPSRRNQFIDMDNIYPQEKGTESIFNEQMEGKHSLWKPYSNVPLQSLKEDSCSSRQKLSRSSHQENTGKRGSPTRIVVLKPNLEKPHDIEEALPLHHKISHSDYRRHKECPEVDRWTPNTEDYMCQVPLGDSETLSRMGKGSREIAREITKQMRAARGGSRKHSVKPETRTLASDERSQFQSSVTRPKTPESIHRYSESCDAWASSSLNSLPTYSTETSESKEAKKHLSNRWKKTRQCQHQETDNDSFNTLGDMLALSDQNASNVATHKMTCRKCPKSEVQSDRIQSSYPLGISTNDGWKDTTTSKLTRSKSLPPSFIRGVQKSNNRKRSGSVTYNEFSMLKDVLKVGPHYSEYAYRSRQRRSLSRDSTIHGDESDPMSTDNEENMVVEREIHVNYEEPINGTAVTYTSGQSQHPTNLDHELDAIGVLDTSSAVPFSNKKSLSPAEQDQQVLKMTTTALDNCFLVPNLDDLMPKNRQRTPTKMTSKVQCLFLNLPWTEKMFTLGILRRSVQISKAKLRLQLGLLKRETTDTRDGSELSILSDDETARRSLPETGESHAFRNTEERDFSYVFDMLAALGIHAANEDDLLDNCYLLECSAGLDLYDDLEQKYDSLILWPVHERKLLFDITNAVLGDMITSVMNGCSKGLMARCSPGWNREEFAELVWQRVVQLRQEIEFNQEALLLSVEWAGSEDGASLVGRDIGNMLQDDLVQEIIADFLGATKSAKLRG